MNDPAYLLLIRAQAARADLARRGWHGVVAWLDQAIARLIVEVNR